MRLREIAFGLTLIGWAGAVCAQDFAVDAVGLRLLAQEALAADDPGTAIELTDALLARDPKDVQALILRSQAYREIGDNDQAIAAARAAWAAAPNDRLAFGAAMVMAQALSSDDRRTAAQLWLRRAAEAAPDDGTRELAERDFAYVRSRNPWIFQFAFSVTPSSNVNDGSSRDVFDYYGYPLVISGDGKALSGIEKAIGFSAIYRLVPTEYTLSRLRFSLYSSEPTLSGEAKDQAPNAQGSDYAYSSIEMGYETEIQGPESLLTYNLGVAAGKNWYGGEDLSNLFRLNFGVERPFGEATFGFVETSFERQFRLDDADFSADIYGISAGVSHILPNNDQISLTLGLIETKSGNVEIAHDSWNARIGWEPAQLIAGMTFSGGVSLEVTDYPFSRYTPDGRHDERVVLDMSVGFPEIEYYGFAPRVDLNIGKTNSNSALFETRELGLRIGIDSTF